MTVTLNKVKTRQRNHKTSEILTPENIHHMPPLLREPQEKKKLTDLTSLTDLIKRNRKETIEAKRRIIEKVSTGMTDPDRNTIKTKRNIEKLHIDLIGKKLINLHNRGSSVGRPLQRMDNPREQDHQRRRGQHFCSGCQNNWVKLLLSS